MHSDLKGMELEIYGRICQELCHQGTPAPHILALLDRGKTMKGMGDVSLCLQRMS